MNTRALATVASLFVAPLLTTVRGDILAYYPLDELSGTVVPNTAGPAPDGALFGDTTWFTDPTRGQVLSFDGTGDYANLGNAAIPPVSLSGAFTWSFWANSEVNTTNATVLGNRYNPMGGEFTPREFIKFTPQAFEYHRNAAGENIDYADFTLNTWAHHMVVQNGPVMTYFRDGRYGGHRVITQGTQATLPLYLGGNQAVENWQGKIDDVALWNNAMPLSSVAKIAAGKVTPAAASTAAPVFATQMSDDFSGSLSLWNVTNRGLENNAPAGYNSPNVSGGTVTLGGTTTSQFWYGSSLESVQSFDSSLETIVSVDRLSLSGTGSAYRSSLWILGDAGHYLHFGQNVVTEQGWAFNARDDGGIGTLGPTGSGNNIVGLNPLDADMGAHNMAIHMVPLGAPGEVWMYLMLDGQIYADQRFSNFPSTFNVVLTGQARATGDSVAATFDNVLVQQVPEPGSVMLLGTSLALLAGRRRRS